ncbi:MAG: SDR family oxidoreductase, partial [SAR202 cluster bacterium]|nr:SDR family oxidoreductase [SAR202 cluster bacterium]
EGASVMVSDVAVEDGKKVAAEIGKQGGNAAFVKLNVTSEADWKAAVAETEKRFGKLDVLVNNAGIFVATLIEKTPEEEWDRVLDINAKGVFFGVHREHLVGRGHRRQRHGGRIHGVQGRGAPVHQGRRAARGQRQHPRQLRASRHDGHRHGGIPAGGQGIPEVGQGDDSPGQSG